MSCKSGAGFEILIIFFVAPCSSVDCGRGRAAAAVAAAAAPRRLEFTPNHAATAASFLAAGTGQLAAPPTHT